MGDVPAGHMSKGVIHAKVDALVNSRDVKGAFDKRASFLAALQKATTSDQYIQILKDQAGVTVKEADYLNEYFYEEGERWRKPETRCSSIPIGYLPRTPRPSK